MTNRSPSLFLTALVLTMVIHLYSIDHLARWLNRAILPQLSDESIEIDIAQVDQLPPLEEFTQKKAPIPFKEKPPKESSKPPLVDTPQKPVAKKKETILNPTHKKQLDEGLSVDKISDPKIEKLPAPKTGHQQKIKTTHPEKKEKLQPEKKTSQEVVKKEEKAELALKEPTKKDELVSPMFLKKPEKKEEPKSKETIPPKITIPEEIQKTFRNGNPEPTKKENLEYSMNTYKWTFKRYVENWAVDIQKWWKAPLDYRYGRVPDGGEMWIQVRLAKSGSLLGYKIVKSNVTAEMELMVIQALVGSLSQPALPELFPKDELIINWRFIYPPMRPEIDLRRR